MTAAMTVMMLWVLGLLGRAAAAAEGEWRADLGWDIVPASQHGVLDLGWRREDWSVEILTDTLEVRYAPSRERGRKWAAVRGEAAVAHLLPDPWQDGGPAPESGFFASYVGVEGGALRYLPRGFYAGAQGVARQYGFRPTPETTVAVPEGRPLLRAEVVVGWWSPAAQVYLLAGGQRSLEPLSPHVQGVGKARGPWRLAPLAEVQVGWAEGQDFLTRTRLGGLSPYGVPLAGAGWAEWWVEDYAALRAGPSLKGRVTQVDLVVDVARFDGGPSVTGLGVLTTTQPPDRRWFLEVHGGAVPWVERQPGVSRVSGWVRAGWRWGQSPG